MIRDAFRRDVHRAINASPPRRIASFGSMALAVGLVITFGAVAPWWVWPIVALVEGIGFLVLGNRWAAKDALARVQSDG